jgi:hypothetical protein
VERRSNEESCHDDVMDENIFQDKATNLFLAMLIAEGLPLSFADSPFLHDFLNFVAPKFHKPSSKTVSGPLLQEQYRKSQQWVTRHLAETSYVAVASDGWFDFVFISKKKLGEQKRKNI